MYQSNPRLSGRAFALQEKKRVYKNLYGQILINSAIFNWVMNTKTQWTQWGYEYEDP